MGKKMFIAILIVLVASTLAYFIYPRLLPSAVSTADTSSAIPTVPRSINARTPGWLAYRSSKFGFSIEYPQNYTLEELAFPDGSYSVIIVSQPEAKTLNIYVGGNGVSRTDSYYGGYTWVKNTSDILSRLDPEDSENNVLEKITLISKSRKKDFSVYEYKSSPFNDESSSNSLNHAYIKDNRSYLLTIADSTVSEFSKIISTFEP